MIASIREFLQRRRYGAPVVVVSGLPRSGTSMMMRMLTEGGLEAAQDGIRAADDDNPRGYFELERVKELDKGGDAAWVRGCRGKVIKVISFLLRHLPGENRYRVLFMQRDIGEVLASQRKMLVRRGEDPDDAADEAMKTHYSAHLRKTAHWLAAQPNLESLDVSHRDALERPAENAARVREFLKMPLDIEAMTQAVDRSLYRNKAPATQERRKGGPQ